MILLTDARIMTLRSSVQPRASSGGVRGDVRCSSASSRAVRSCSHLGPDAMCNSSGVPIGTNSVSLIDALRAVPTPAHAAEVSHGPNVWGQIPCQPLLSGLALEESPARCPERPRRIGYGPFGEPVRLEIVYGARCVPSRRRCRILVSVRPKARLVQRRTQPGPELARWIERCGEEPSTGPDPLRHAIHNVGSPA